MPYSAVTQPAPLLRRKGGTDSSTEAVQRTRVSPMAIKAEPSAYLFTPVVMVTGRSSSLRRPSMRMVVPLQGVAILSLSWQLVGADLNTSAAMAQGRRCRSARAVDRVRKAVLDSPVPKAPVTEDSPRRKERAVLAALCRHSRRERHAVASHPLIERARQHGRTLLTELESKQLLHDVGIPTT